MHFDDVRKNKFIGILFEYIVSRREYERKASSIAVAATNH